MKVLWITNIVLPPACEALNIKAPVTGGWMLSSAKRLLECSDVELAVATVYNGVDLKSLAVDGITYYLLPSGGKHIAKYNKSLEKYWLQIKGEYVPDIVHIHGTEMAHGLAYIRSCGADSVVASIQGLVSVYERYYYGGISLCDMMRNITFRDIIRWDNIFQQRANMAERGEREKDYISTVQHIIGRTEWDRSQVLAVNPKVNYHFCNETLRGVFYQNQWQYDKCEHHSIFLSQAGYPIKGLHKVLEAARLVIREFPDLKIYIAGSDITKSTTCNERLRIGGYGKYIKSLIKRYGLQKCVCFTGPLNEQQICERYLGSNLFICPSSIENSPNSLGEAQLLGMPFLSSYVGGSPDMVNNISPYLLYRFEEIEMLADKICTIFRQTVWPHAERSIEVAKSRHDGDTNRDRLLEIYKNINKKNES
ncbi:MAG: glycosyltransferase [Bacteroidales bacterium]